MKVLICADSIQKTMKVYLRQLAEAGIPSEWGAPAKPIGHEAQAWRPKLEWVLEKLRAQDPKEKIILSDGWDVLFQGTREQVEEEFPHAGTILLAGEKNCWPDPKVQIQYPMGPTPWMFVNAGTIAGRAEDLLAELERGFSAGLPELLEDDQRLWTWLFITGNQKILRNIFIDYSCRLFQTTLLNIVGTELAIETNSGKLHNLKTGTIPAFLHCNGGQDWTSRELELMRISA